MALEVVRQTIIRFDAEYLNKIRARLDDDTPTDCRSCARDFEPFDILHCDYGRSSKRVVRHLKCAIFHKVLTITEAKQLAPKDLQIDWQAIQEELAARRRFLTVRVCSVALALLTIGTSLIHSINLAL